MPKALTDFPNTTSGRWIIKAALITFGALVSGGMIPLDMPVAFGQSLGDLLVYAGILTPTGQMNPGFTDRLQS